MKEGKLKFRYCPRELMMVVEDTSKQYRQRPELYESEVMASIRGLVEETLTLLEEAKKDNSLEEVERLEDEYETYLTCLSDCYFGLLEDLPFKYTQ